MRALIDRFGRWQAESIGNRISTVLIGLTLTFLLVTGAGNFAYLLHLTNRASASSLDEKIRDAANQIETLFAEVINDGVQLSKNPTLVSALLDAQNQETYVQPVLTSFTPRGRTPQALCLVDYKGRPIGCAKTDRNPVAPFDASAIDSGAAKAGLLQAPGRDPVLRISTPVIYEGTGRAEGAIVAEYDVREMLRPILGRRSGLSHVHVESDAIPDLVLEGSKDVSIHHDHPIVLPPPADALKLTFSAGVDRGDFHAPVLRLLAVYSVLAILLVLAAVLVARRLTPPLIARLSDMTDAARRIAAGQDVPLDARVADGGKDEIGQLAAAFSVMTGRLQLSNRKLEERVGERTAELREKEALLRDIVDAVPGAIYQLRLAPGGAMQVSFASSGLLRTLGVHPDLVREDAARLFSVIDPEDAAAIRDEMQRSAGQLTPWHKDYRVRLLNGRDRWVSGTAVPKRTADGGVVWHGIITDITAHKEAELALEQSEAYAQALFKGSYIPLVVVDGATGRFIDCNAAAVAIYRLESIESVLGKTPADVSAPTQYDGMPSEQSAREHIATARRDGFHVFEWRHQRPDGEVWDAEVRLMAFRHRGKELLQFSLRDISDQKRSEAETWRRANFDGLTGLANRSLCLDRMARALEQARRLGTRVGVIFADLDGFKDVNDRLGHAAGDRLLVDVARRLENCVRAQDTVARFGGDEFVLLVQDLTEPADLDRVAEATLAALFRPFALGEASCRISGSLGIALYPDHGDDVERLLDQADQALYRSKRAGKNRYHFASG